MGVSLHRGPAGGTWRRDFFAGDFERRVKEGSGGGTSLSLWGLCEGTWWEGSHTEDSKIHVVEGSGKGAFVFTGAP